MKNSTEIHIAVIGGKEVGKTALCTRYTQSQYPTRYRSTKGCDVYSKEDFIGRNQPVTLILSEIGAGYLDMFHHDLKKIVSTVMICCDVTAYAWHTGLCESIKEAKNYFPNAHLTIVVTKSDKISTIKNIKEQNRINQQLNQIKQIAEKNNASLIKTSAQNNGNVDDAFRSVVAKALNQNPEPSLTKAPPIKSNTTIQANTKNDFLAQLKTKVDQECFTRADILDLFTEMKKPNGIYAYIHQQRNPMWDQMRLFFKASVPTQNEDNFWHTSTYQKAVKMLKEAYIARNEDETCQERQPEVNQFIDYVRGNSPMHYSQTSTRQSIGILKNH
jgi:GTPase SAR1 family protein